MLTLDRIVLIPSQQMIHLKLTWDDLLLAKVFSHRWMMKLKREVEINST